jgi:hypothetical protein
MNAIRSALVALLAAGAIVALLLAADARSSRGALAHGDAVYAATPSRASWLASTHFGSAAERLLGTADDLVARCELYVDASPPRPSRGQGGERAGAPNELARGRRDRHPARARRPASAFRARTAARRRAERTGGVFRTTGRAAG